MKTYIIKKEIIPNKIIFKNKIFFIKELNKKYIIKNTTIHTSQDDCILEIYLYDCKHPNCNPDNNLFCIPIDLLNIKLNKFNWKLIENTLKTYNLNSCYFTPWKDIKYCQE